MGWELHPAFQFSKFRTINFWENDRKPSLTFIDEAHIYLKAKSPVPQNSIGTSRDFGLIHSRPQLGAEPTKWLRLLPDFGPDKNGGSESCELVKPHQPLQNDILSLSHSLAALAASMMDIEWKKQKSSQQLLWHVETNFKSCQVMQCMAGTEPGNWPRATICTGFEFGSQLSTNSASDGTKERRRKETSEEELIVGWSGLRDKSRHDFNLTFGWFRLDFDLLKVKKAQIPVDPGGK